MDKRTRRFIYEYKNPDEGIIENLREIDCIYHIYGYKENVLHGFIIFKYTKTEKAASKTVGVGCIKSTKDAMQSMNEIKNLAKIWEKGDPPQRMKTKLVTPEDAFASIIKQNSILINMAVTNNMHLHEQNERLEMALHEKPPPMIISNSNNDNSKNKRITNINVFLNTECKDAITLKDFVSKLVITEDDLECMKQLGYVESVTRLLKRSLNEYGVTERPIHCIDVKRDILHVKDQEGWKKEISTKESPNIDKAFKHLTHIHRRKMSDIYKDVEPDSKEFEEKAKIMYQIASSGGTEEDKYKKKIMRNISNEIRIPIEYP